MIDARMKRQLDSLGVKPTPGENGWPEEMHVPNVRGLIRGSWLYNPGSGCGTRGCLVGHVGYAFLDGSYIERRTHNENLPPSSWGFMGLLLVRLGMPTENARRVLRHCAEERYAYQMYMAASNMFEFGSWRDKDGVDHWIDGGRPGFPEVVEAWLDVTEYCGYEVTRDLRVRMLREIFSCGR